MHNSSYYRPNHGGNLAWASALAGCSPQLIVDFSASINPLGPPVSAIAAIQANFDRLVHYPDPGYAALREAIGHFHQISPEWIFPGNGAAELLTWAARELADQETTYVLVPAFGDYVRALRAVGARVEQVALWEKAGELRRVWDSQMPLHKLLELPKAATQNAALLLNNPHNPTGTLLSREAILPLVERFALVVIDEAFMDFLLPGQQESLIDQVYQLENLVILRSLTKFYSLPGLRLGYAITHPDRLARWQQWRDPWSVNVLAEVAGIAVLQDHAFQQQTWQWLLQARSQLYQGLAQLPGLKPIPGVANFLLVESVCSVMELQQQLLQQYQVLIRDCLSFPELGDRFFRVAVRTEAENQTLLGGLVEILGESEDGMIKC